MSSIIGHNNDQEPCVKYLALLSALPLSYGLARWVDMRTYSMQYALFQCRLC